jgi:hypothetical protein
MERLWWPRFSQLLVVSDADAAAVRQICPAARALVYPNALPSVVCPRPAKQDVVVFSGNMEYHPNVMAVRFFRREIWPLLRERWPDLVWRLVARMRTLCAHLQKAIPDPGDWAGGRCHRGTGAGRCRGSAAGWKRHAAEDCGGLGGRLRGGFDQPGRRRAGGRHGEHLLLADDAAVLRRLYRNCWNRPN